MLKQKEMTVDEAWEIVDNTCCLWGTISLSTKKQYNGIVKQALTVLKEQGDLLLKAKKDSELLDKLQEMLITQVDQLTLLQYYDSSGFRVIDSNTNKIDCSGKDLRKALRSAVEVEK